MTVGAPAAIAFVTSPEYLMPPSAMTDDVRRRERLRAVGDGGDLRHADAGDDARRADAPGPMPTFTASTPAR